MTWRRTWNSKSRFRRPVVLADPVLERNRFAKDETLRFRAGIPLGSHSLTALTARSTSTATWYQRLSTALTRWKSRPILP